MRARKALAALVLATMSLSLAVTSHAEAPADASNGGTSGSVSSAANGPAPCIDLDADCSTLMINYSGDAVEFALFRRESVEEETNGADSTGYAASGEQAAPTGELSGNGKVKTGNSSQLPGVDFLRGFRDRDIDPAFKDAIAAWKDGATRDGNMHDWAHAAAASIDYNDQQPSPDGIAAQGDSSGNSPAFWDFAYVYHWAVEENVLDSGRCDISQVALSDIYLQPKINSSSDPQIVVCELNAGEDCRPLSD